MFLLTWVFLLTGVFLAVEDVVKIRFKLEMVYGDLCGQPEWSFQAGSGNTETSAYSVLVGQVSQGTPMERWDKILAKLW